MRWHHVSQRYWRTPCAQRHFSVVELLREWSRWLRQQLAPTDKRAVEPVQSLARAKHLAPRSIESFAPSILLCALKSGKHLSATGVPAIALPHERTALSAETLPACGISAILQQPGERLWRIGNKEMLVRNTVDPLTAERRGDNRPAHRERLQNLQTSARASQQWHDGDLRGGEMGLYLRYAALLPLRPAASPRRTISAGDCARQDAMSPPGRARWMSGQICSAKWSAPWTLG